MGKEQIKNIENVRVRRRGRYDAEMRQIWTCFTRRSLPAGEGSRLAGRGDATAERVKAWRWTRAGALFSTV
jgi:hypothetical protein